MTGEKPWPKNQRTYRDEAAGWLQMGINQLNSGNQTEAMYSLTTALRWLEKSGAEVEPVSVENIKVLREMGLK
jgi:hypothetical protein